MSGRPTRLRYALDPRGKADLKDIVIRSERLDLEVSDTVLTLEKHALRRQRVHVGGLNPIYAITPQLRSQIVRHDKQHIRLI